MFGSRLQFEEDFLRPDDGLKEHWKKMEKAIRYGKRCVRND
jgi:hypothetical protein